MATTVSVGGIVTSVPGAYSEVDTSGLRQVGIAATGVVAVVGEAEGGQPQKVYSFTNPAKVAKTFRSGDLLEAARFLFDPSADDRAPSGAAKMLAVKVNPATPSSAKLYNAYGAAVDVKSRDHGAFTQRVNVQVGTGSNGGKALTVEFDGTEEQFDDVGADAPLQFLYSALTDGADSMEIGIDPTAGVSAKFTKTGTGKRADYQGEISFPGKDDEQAGDADGVTAAEILSDSAADTGIQVTLYGVVGGSVVSETLTLNGTTPVAGSQVWDAGLLLGVYVAGTTAGTVTVRHAGGGATLYTVPAASGAHGRAMYLPTSAIECAGGTLEFVADAATTKKLIVIGTNASDVAQIELITLNGTTPVTTAGSWNSVTAIALGDVEAARTVTAKGLLFDSGATVSIVSDNAADTMQAYIFGLTVAGAAQSELVTLTGTTPVQGTATWSKVFGVLLASAATGAVSISASAGGSSLKLGTIAAGSRSWGIIGCGGLAYGGTPATLQADAATSKDVVVFGEDPSGAIQVEKLTLNGTTPVTGAQAWKNVKGIAAAHVEAERTLTLSGSFTLAIADYDTVQDVIDFFEAVNTADAQYWTVTTEIGDPAGFAIADMDLKASTSVKTGGAAVDYYAVLHAVIQTLNEKSLLVEADKSSGATQAPPNNTTSPVYLTGGAEGTTTTQDWQDALDLLRKEYCNTVVVLTDSAAIHALVKEHCAYMARQGQQERDAKLGAPSGTTLDEAKSLVRALNSRHCALCIQDVVRYNSQGEKETFPPYFTAVLAAGMQAGNRPGVPMTAKYVNVLDVQGDSSYDPTDDGDELIQSGLHVLTYVQNIGWRWLRAVTTNLTDPQNLAYVEQSTNYATNYAVYNLRTLLQRMVGEPGFAGSPAAALGLLTKVLALLIQEGVIVAWKDAAVTLSGDQLQVEVSIAPTLPINFVPINIHLYTAEFSAAT